jgi:type VI secretion system protein ImpM
VTTRTAAETAVDTDRIGFFGKVPTHGDFVATGLDRQLQGMMDEWIQSGIQACEAEFGAAWEEMFTALPPWRFVIGRSIWSSAPIAGVLLPSKDRVGRSFPLVIAAQLASYHGKLTRLCTDHTWFIAAEALAETSTKRDFDINALIAGLKRLRLPRGEDGENADGVATDLPSVWWMVEPESRKAIGFRTEGVPGPVDFKRLLDTPQSVTDNQQQASPPTALPPGQAPEPEPHPQVSHETRPRRIKHSHATHPGTRQTVNAEALLISDKPPLYAVASSIGGTPGAANAAKLTTNVLAATESHESIAAMVQEVKGKLGRAHALLQTAPRPDEHLQVGAGMAVATFAEDSFAVVWAGHVRCYLVRDGMMRCLTRDHVEIGMRFALSRFVGSHRQFVPEVLVEEAKDGDVMLLCSMALPRVLGERTVAQILLETPMAQAADTLIQEGLIADASDNLSAIVLGISQ